MQNLAGLLQDQNKLADAEPLMRESLKIRREIFTAGHPEIALGLNGLALILEAQNKRAEAELLYWEALEIWRAAYSAKHPDIAAVLLNLAGILSADNKLAEAEPLYRESLGIIREARPAGHPEIAKCLSGLAVLYWRQGKLDQSVPIFEEVLKEQEAALGRTHLDTLYSIVNLGVNYKDAGRIAEAIPLLEEADKASKRVPSIAIARQHLLDAYAKAADPAKPESIEKVVTQIHEMLNDQRATLPKDSAQLAGRIATYSMPLLKLKVWNEAEPLIREALTIREKLEPDASTTFNTKLMLGEVLLGQKKYPESGPLLVAGYEGLKLRESNLPPQAANRIPEALDRLIELYIALGKSDEVETYQELRKQYSH